MAVHLGNAASVLDLWGVYGRVDLILSFALLLLFHVYC